MTIDSSTLTPGTLYTVTISRGRRNATYRGMYLRDEDGVLCFASADIPTVIIRIEREIIDNYEEVSDAVK